MIRLEARGHRSLVGFFVFFGETAFVYIVPSIVTANSVSNRYRKIVLIITMMQSEAFRI